MTDQPDLFGTTPMPQPEPVRPRVLRESAAGRTLAALADTGPLDAFGLAASGVSSAQHHATRLVREGLAERCAGGWRITVLGRAVLADQPDRGRPTDWHPGYRRD